MKKVTIVDIAKKAGTSTATVSRVLNGQALVSPQTASHVLQIARELNYPVLQYSSRKKSMNFGMLLAGYDDDLPQSSFFHEVILGASLEAEAKRASFTFAPLTEQNSAFPEMLRRGGLDGLIVGGVPISDALVKQLKSRAFPTVFIGRYLEHGEHLNYVAPDNMGGGRIAAHHLLQMGHRRIAILNGPERINVFHDRLRGALEVLTDAQILDVINAPMFDEKAGYEAAHQILSRSEKPTAILAMSDWMAIGALRAAHECKLSIPDDLSIVGFSDLPISQTITPSLTTIRIPQRKLGAMAIQLLDLLIRHELETPIGIVIPLELVKRESTKEIASS